MSNVDKALTFIESVRTGDAALATSHLDAERYVEHDPRIGYGVAGVREFVGQFASEGGELRVVRVLGDGDQVVIQSDGNFLGEGTFFDAFRFEGGRIVEHWGFSAPAGPPNRSGHTQVDGPTVPDADADAERSKSVIRQFYDTVHVHGSHELIPGFFDGDFCVRHEPGVADGVAEFQRDLAVLTNDRTIDEIVHLVGQGDLVFITARGTHAGEPCVYVDLYRVADGKLAEHWGFPEQVPWIRENGNAML